MLRSAKGCVALVTAGLLACTDSTDELDPADAQADVGAPIDAGDVDAGPVDGGPGPAACLREVTVGSGFACALRTDGRVLCWGNNDRGQLGDGTLDARSEPRPVRSADGTPLEGIVEVGAGGSHACARSETGAVFCWGLGSSGELGRGSTTGSAPTPAAMQSGPGGPPVADAAGLALGVTSSCVIRAGGEIGCTGLNNTGQLGDGTTRDRGVLSSVVRASTGQPVTGLVDADMSGFFGCGFGAQSAWCWGRSDGGQLGDGRTPMEPRAAVQPALMDLDFDPIVDISAGIRHACVVRASGALWCWGALDDFFGGLGTIFSLATPTRLDEAPDAFALARGPDGGHICVVTQDARLSCMGRNHRGQLGDGTTEGRAEFELVRFEDGSPVERVVSAAQTQLNTCVTLDDDTVWCWGANDGGQLGRPAGGESTAPVFVDGVCPS